MIAEVVHHFLDFLFSRKARRDVLGLGSVNMQRLELDHISERR